MDFPTLKIARQKKPRSGRQVKTREFSATLIAYVTADPLWELGQNGSAVRPAWITYAASREMARAFTANLRGGHKAAVGGRVNHSVFELPKSARHRWLAHQHPGGGLLTTAYLPELFDLDPGATPEAIAFVFLPPSAWLDEQAQALVADFGDVARDAARAALFAAFLDRRTLLPLVKDLRFHLQLYRAALEAPWTEPPGRTRYEPGNLYAEGLDACGLDAPLLVRVSHPDFELFLREQTAEFSCKELAHGTHRFDPSRRLLSYPQAHPRQLRLDLAVA